MNEPLILAVDSGGTPRQWVTCREAVDYYVKDMVAWEHGNESFVYHGGISRATEQISTVTMKPIIAIRGTAVGKALKRVDAIPGVSSRLLFRRDRHICAYCGGEYDERDLTKDHIMPSSRGGRSTWMNLVAACRSCNRRKDDRTPEESHMPLLYVPYIPNRHEFLILANRRILADQMDFLKAGVGKNSRILLEV